MRLSQLLKKVSFIDVFFRAVKSLSQLLSETTLIKIIMHECQPLTAYERLTAWYFHEISENWLYYGSYLYILGHREYAINIKYKKQKAT